MAGPENNGCMWCCLEQKRTYKVDKICGLNATPFLKSTATGHRFLFARTEVYLIEKPSKGRR
jgi:hypothetical protein